VICSSERRRKGFSGSVKVLYDVNSRVIQNWGTKSDIIMDKKIVKFKLHGHGLEVTEDDYFKTIKFLAKNID